LSDETLAEGVPTSTESGFAEISDFAINRVVGGPPDMPADVVKALSDTLMEVTASDSFVAWAEGSGTGLLPMDAAATTAMMEELSQFYAKYAPILKQAKN
jgi:tripartite-type tricarboxylate transporter receptor subunit TctC